MKYWTLLTVGLCACASYNARYQAQWTQNLDKLVQIKLDTAEALGCNPFVAQISGVPTCHAPLTLPSLSSDSIGAHQALMARYWGCNPFFTPVKDVSRCKSVHDIHANGPSKGS